MFWLALQHAPGFVAQPAEVAEDRFCAPSDEENWGQREKGATIGRRKNWVWENWDGASVELCQLLVRLLETYGQRPLPSCVRIVGRQG